MENNEFQKKLDVILNKRRNCIPLTDEEELIVSDALNKLLDGKKCVRKSFETKTGDEIRKSDSSPELKKPARTGSPSEGPLPKARGQEGGYDSKADVAERKDVTPDPKNTPAGTRSFSTPDKKEEKLPKEDNSGKAKEEYLKDDNSNTDEKEHRQESYEEDRIGRYTEHGTPKDSIQVQPKDIVTKSLTSGAKRVGMVLKVYEPDSKTGQRALMVKWSDGTYSHENLRTVEILKAEKTPSVKSEEDNKVSPPIVEAKKATATGGFTQHIHVHSHAPESATKPEEQVVPKAEAKPAEVAEKPVEDKKSVELPKEPPQEFIDEVVSTLKDLTDMSDQEILDLAQATWNELVSGASGTKEESVPTDEEKKTENTTKGLGEFLTEAGGVGVGVAAGDVLGGLISEALKPKKPKQPKADTIKSDEVEKAKKVEKDEMMPGETRESTPITTTAGEGTRMSSTVPTYTFGSGESVHLPKDAASQDDTTKAEKAPSDWLDRCVERVQEESPDVDSPWAVCQATWQRKKGVQTGDVVKISVEDMKEICPTCAEKMIKNNIKFYKIAF